MSEAFGLAAQMFFAGSMIFGIAYVVRAYLREGIPQDEIDAEARELIARNGAGALSVAEGNAQRAQWSKGNNDKLERAERVLKAVHQSARFHG